MGTGRKKIPIRQIENVSRRRVTFCKRRNGLFKKSRELSTLTPGCRVAVLAFSASTTAHVFDTDNDETHDLISFLEQAADAVFGNPNFQIPTTSNSLLLEESTADPISNPNFEIGSTSHSFLVQGASAVNDKGDTFSNPTSEAIRGDQYLNLGDKESLCLTEEELFDLMGSDVSSVSICASTAEASTMNLSNCTLPQDIIANSPSCPPLEQSTSPAYTPTDDLMLLQNNNNTNDHRCNRNAVTQQIISNNTDQMQMQHDMTTNTNYWNNNGYSTLPQEIIPSSPSFPPFKQPTSPAYTATDDLMQLQNNTNTDNHGYNINVAPQQIIYNNTDLMRMQHDMTTNTNYWNCNGYTMPQEIIPNNTPSCPPFEYYCHDQTTANSYADYDNYMRNYVPMELMMQFASSSNATSTPSNTGLWNDELLGLSQFGSGDAQRSCGCSNEDECLCQLFLRKQRLEALRQYMLLNVSSSFWKSQQQI